MSRHSDTAMFPRDRGLAAERLRARLLEARLVEPTRLDAALAEYTAAAPPVSFASFLLERGVLTVDQLPALQLERAPEEHVEVAPGARFSGCVIGQKLGEGGMGTVYAARREQDGLAVVVKFLAAAHARNPMWRARFLREALVVRRIEHPNVIRVYSVEAEGPRPHIVMELVEGEDLQERLDRGGKLTPQEVARIGRDLARGLAAAHAQHVIHRDLKPGNVRISADGTVKLLDFGLAKNVQADDGISVAGQVMGTPHYMAPEQWGDHAVDGRADVFSLGATLYHLLTGRVPFSGKSPGAICRQAREGDFPRPRTLVPDAPEDLELVLLRAMSVERRARYPTAAAVADDLERVLAGKPVEVPCLVARSDGRRYPLIPALQFTVGRAEDASVPLLDPSVSRQQARIDRVEVGYRLYDLGSTYGSFVNGMQVEQVLLKDHDVVRFGRVELEFRDGGMGQALSAPTRRLSRDRLRVRPVPEPFLDALVAAGDKRSVLALIERLPLRPLEAHVSGARTALRELIGGEVAERAGSRLEHLLRERRAQAADRLFQITHENLADDFDAWLTWWNQTRGAYPPQIGPIRLRARQRLRVVAGEDGDRAVALDDRSVFRIGRGSDSHVLLNDRSISRHHATVLRLHERLMIRDEGSRFATRVNGREIETAFLEPGDRIGLGLVELVLEADDPIAAPPRAADGSYLIEPALFDALLAQPLPCLAGALLRFVIAPAHDGWVDAVAAGLHPDGEAARRCAEDVRAAFAARARRALEALPEALPELAQIPPGSDWSGWTAHVKARWTELAPQLLPVAWVPGADPVERE